ncbi:MAG: hypothetical protein K0R57_1448 [Paenibacillaceae bacterium]|jgi:glutathione synthase/RimK-type ligase-like ATP-grasp enzyme|nr:hypothetical protein [Paenibacillaceae bacterium]
MNKESGKSEAPVTRISNKLTKTRVLERSEELRSHIPLTRMLTKGILREMLQKYGMVYVKPCCGSCGQGVMRVEKHAAADGEGSGAGASGRRGSRPNQLRPVQFRYQSGTAVKEFADYGAMYQAILKETQGKPYLVQKGIRLLRHNGRPFDIRVMVQRSPKGKWEATGVAGRVAHPRKAVTNGSQGGTIYPAAVLLQSYAGKEQGSKLVSAMNRLGVQAAVRLSSAYPGLNEIGVDIALDRTLVPYILEVNTYPDPCPFTKLQDGSMLRRIIRYGRAYGRSYQLKCIKAKRGMN